MTAVTLSNNDWVVCPGVTTSLYPYRYSTSESDSVLESSSHLEFAVNENNSTFADAFFLLEVLLTVIISFSLAAYVLFIFGLYVKLLLSSKHFVLYTFILLFISMIVVLIALNYEHGDNFFNKYMKGCRLKMEKWLAIIELVMDLSRTLKGSWIQIKFGLGPNITQIVMKEEMLVIEFIYIKMG